MCGNKGNMTNVIKQKEFMNTIYGENNDRNIYTIILFYKIYKI